MQRAGTYVPALFACATGFRRDCPCRRPCRHAGCRHRSGSRAAAGRQRLSRTPRSWLRAWRAESRSVPAGNGAVRLCCSPSCTCVDHSGIAPAPSRKRATGRVTIQSPGSVPPFAAIPAAPGDVAGRSLVLARRDGVRTAGEQKRGSSERADCQQAKQAAARGRMNLIVMGGMRGVEHNG
jgi:hypothetical protein